MKRRKHRGPGLGTGATLGGSVPASARMDRGVAKERQPHDEHTPGPWSFTENDDAAGIFGKWAVYEVGNAELNVGIALVSGRAANARLIAAAPNMLFALKIIADVSFDEGMRKLAQDAVVTATAVEEEEMRLRCQRTYRRAVEWRTKMVKQDMEELLQFARLLEPGDDQLKDAEELLTGALLAVKLERRRHADEATAITILTAG